RRATNSPKDCVTAIRMRAAAGPNSCTLASSGRKTIDEVLEPAPRPTDIASESMPIAIRPSSPAPSESVRADTAVQSESTAATAASAVTVQTYRVTSRPFMSTRPPRPPLPADNSAIENREDRVYGAHQ